MQRPIVSFAALACACVPAFLSACAAEPEMEVATASQSLAVSNFTREHITGDVYHYGFEVTVGTTANARLRIHRVVRERAPGIPRRTNDAVMMLHGDFATFVTNFVPVLGEPASSVNGLATWLAQRNIDVWGVDRRWTLAPEEGADLSDFDAMGIAQELHDLGDALAFARGVRLITDASIARMSLVGFSRGGELAYFYASQEAALPVWQRHVKGLVPLDVYVSLAPEDEDTRQFFCWLAGLEYELLAEGEVDSPSSFQQTLGQLALSAPDEPTPISFLSGLTNREAMLYFVGQSYDFFPASPLYHLAAPVLDGFNVVGLRKSAEDVIASWLAGAPPHASMRESADTDALTCGDAPLPVDLPLARIQVPLLLIAAAGGYGEHALYSTTQVGSTDVTTRIVRTLPPEQEAEDFGHGDLLYSPDAAALAWQPLLGWLRAH